MSHFTVYMDKENNSSTSVANPSAAQVIRSGPVGKTFHSTHHIRTGPRRALGDVNTFNKEKQSTEVKLPQKHLIQHNWRRGKAKENKSQKVATEKEVNVQPVEVYEEIESVFPYDEEKEDDFEDIWPKQERPSEFMSEFRLWRPLGIFPRRTKSSTCFLENEESEEEKEELSRQSESDTDESHLAPPLHDVAMPDMDFSNSDLEDMYFHLS